jgi:hypothetical protein
MRGIDDDEADVEAESHRLRNAARLADTSAG